MTARLDLLAHGTTPATRAARFPDDETLEASVVGALEALSGRLRPYDQALTAPARAARDTAAALSLDAFVEPALRDCDYGRWCGLASKDVAEREPDAFAAWLGDPASAPHGGEFDRSFNRASRRLAHPIVGARKRDAGRHPRLRHASGDGERARRRSLGLCSDRCRAAFACSIERSRGTLESCGARPFGRLVVRGAWIALIAALVMLASSASQAHRISTSGGPPPAGVSIPSLTHGQIVVIRDNLPAIRALASARLGFDLTTWRLEDYLNLQSFACLWGIVPGSITDEESPFNECAHAYLAAGRALLLQLGREHSADHKAIDALTSKIEVEMLADGASMNLCRYSDEPFNTNEIIWPHWGMALSYPPTLATLGAVFTLIAGSIIWLGRRDKRSAGLPQPSA